MKSRFIFSCLLFISTASLAQTSGLPNYNYNTKLEVRNQNLFIQEDSKLDSFALDNNLKLKKLNDTTSILNALHFDASHRAFLRQQFSITSPSAQNLIELLIQNANNAEGQRIIFTSENTTQNSGQQADELIPIETVEDKSDSSPFGLWTWIGLLAGLIGGLALGYMMGSKKRKASENTKIITPNTDAGINDTLAQTKAELANIKTSLQQQLDFDKQYFEQSFETIVKPLENALEAKDTKTILPLLIKAMSHYTAITRFKLEKKQSFDLANMQILMRRTTYQKSDFPVIDKNTSPDNIPNKLKSLIDLLRAAQAKEVKETIVSGYKIENL